MRIAIHDHELNVHKLYDSALGEVFELDEGAANQVDVKADGHLVNGGGRWILEIMKPASLPEGLKSRSEISIGIVTEDTALEQAMLILAKEHR